jgi:hypothetical protein
MGAMGLRGSIPEEVDETTLGYFERGKQLGAWMADRFIRQYGAEDVVLEKPVAWAAGIAHTDIVVKSQRLAVEVKSAADPRPLDYHLKQLAGEVEFDPDVDHGALVIVNPSNLFVRTLPMVVVPDELRDEVHEIASTVARAADPASPLPGRTCARPSDAMSKMCPFAVECFADWVAPDPVEIADDVALLVAQHVELDEEIKQAKAAVDDAEERRRVVRAELAKTIEPAREYLSLDDELVVRRTAVAGRVLVDVQLAAEMGAIGPDVMTALAPFTRQGKGFDRWTVKPAHLIDSGEKQDPARALAGLLDFGDVAPF